MVDFIEPHSFLIFDMIFLVTSTGLVRAGEVERWGF
jgi:hypothetical protein